MERKVNLQVVHRFLHHPLTEAQQELYAQLAENSHSHDIAGHAIVIATAQAPDYGDEISTLAHKLRDVYEPSALFLLVDLGDRIQMVARSNNEAVDVGAVAQEMGGGGHARAAAVLVRRQTLAEVEEQLLSLLHQQVKPLLTVGQIMTQGNPVTVTPETTIGDMAIIVQRYGFEGYPVLESTDLGDNGRPRGGVDELRGIITRRQVDRAQQHGLAAHPVSNYMRTGQVFITPEQSVSELRKLMIVSGWGQIPVVDQQERRIIGIVTRTDLIKLWGEPQVPRREEIARRMEATLPEELLSLLRIAGQTAQELRFPLYAVGGFVRDLLLDRPNFDVDLVVEGNAIKLARKLSERYGGRVRSHRRFGTAKWILPSPQPAAEAQDGDDPSWMDALALALNGTGRASLPSALDFVTARTEFYAEPTALPTVEHSSIKQDLHRRDFTINTLAICLNPDQWGELLDFYGGERDLREGLIRVLHTHSFVDDPTRILRAVRFEQRFRFRLEQRTAELIESALDLLERVTPARVRHELELIAAEEEPERALHRLDEIGATERIHPSLRTDDWVSDRFVELRAALAADPELGRRLQPLALLYFAIWTYRLEREQLDEVNARLQLTRNSLTQLDDLHQLKSRADRLQDPELTRSQIFRILNQANETSRFLLHLVTESSLVRERIDLFERELRHVQHLLDGADLKRLGVKPGPLYRTIFDAARDAWLDGTVTSLAEERALVEKLIAAHGKDSRSRQ